jgi:transposase
MVTNIRPPIFVRTLAKEEREALEEGLRSSEAFVLRRCQILLASARGERAPQIAKNLRCGQQTVRDAIHDFDERGLDALKAISSRPTEVHAAFDEQSALSLRQLLHRSPRELGRQSTLWTLKDAAEVSFEEGLTSERVSGETIRATLSRLGVRWELSPSTGSRVPIRNTPEKRGSRPADPPRREPSTVGCGVRGGDLVFSLRAACCAFLVGCHKADTPS